MVPSSCTSIVVGLQADASHAEFVRGSDKSAEVVADMIRRETDEIESKSRRAMVMEGFRPRKSRH